MAFLLSKLPSLSALLSAYGSLSATIILIRTILCQIIPNPVRDYISSKLSRSLSHYFSPDFTFIIEEHWQAVNNETFRAVEAYLSTRIGPSAGSILIGSNSLDPHNLEQGIPVGCTIIDQFQGMQLEWSLGSIGTNRSFHMERRYFQLTCKKSDQQRVMESYFHHIASTAKTILRGRQNLRIYTYDRRGGRWESAVFKHPATFKTLAMEPERKEEIINNLNSFVRRKDYFQKRGRAWKCGYLLHGPPGTGKSSLVAAIANHLRYNIYDLQLQSVQSDADLRRILTSTTNRSILLVEDIDCSTKASRDRIEIKDDQEEHGEDYQTCRLSPSDPGLTLSGLLNFIDGLWSSCGDERVIIFTTNHKDKLDPALIRPGRMDYDVYMGYCSFAGFKQLAETYLQIKHHRLFAAIEDLLKKVSVTPAEVAQQLMKSDEPQATLESFIEFLEIERN
ncbi:hypothetical protein SLE2022_061430 [Rubroshorea leprosula]